MVDKYGSMPIRSKVFPLTVNPIKMKGRKIKMTERFPLKHAIHLNIAAKKKKKIFNHTMRKDY